MNDIHPLAVIGPDVEMADGNVIGPYAVILGPVRLGTGNWIGSHTVIGAPAEIRGIDHGTAASACGAGIVIGDRNVFREHVTIHQGHYAITRIGHDTYVMNRSYIGHDGEIGDNVTMASGVTLGGHVHVGAAANLGMGAIVHQHRLVGPGSMIGMGAIVTRDVPPFALAYGNPCRVKGANRVGMERAGVPTDVVDAIDNAYTNDLPPIQDEHIARAWDWWSAENDSMPAVTPGTVLDAERRPTEA